MCSSMSCKYAQNMLLGSGVEQLAALVIGRTDARSRQQAQVVADP